MAGSNVQAVLSGIVLHVCYEIPVLPVHSHICHRSRQGASRLPLLEP